MGHLRTGDCVEDEWFVVYLLKKLSTARADVACRVTDTDGELLLIEAALAVPRWLSPSNAENRCWLRGGQVHLLPKPTANESEKLSVGAGLARLRVGGGTIAKAKVQQAVEKRLEGYPRKAMELSRHVVRVVVPIAVAKLLTAFPQLVAVAVDHLPPPSPTELKSLRQEIDGGATRVHFDCLSTPEAETVCVAVRFTRYQFARFVGLRCHLPQRFMLKHWRTPPGQTPPERAMRFGTMVCAGLEAAFLQNTRSATTAVRWHSPSVSLPGTTVLPWLDDASFMKYATALESPVTGSQRSVRAFVQQHEVDVKFQTAVAEAWDATREVDLSACWRDRDDAEDWMNVSIEDIDGQMASRQAEFDAFDKRHRKQETANASETGAADGSDLINLQKDLAAMGSRVSEMLGETSRVDGIEVGGAAKKESRPSAHSSDTESDSDGAGPLDVLGMEDSTSDEGDEGDDDADEFSSKDMREYMAALDGELKECLDRGQDPTAQGPMDSEGLPLTSHHVPVDVAPLELDVHAMENILASFSAEQNFEPGPAALLLGQLGLASAKSGHVGRADALDTMD